ncbi:pyridoxamine 5'-phosphate oxidase family protein [Halocatena marina]|uniref:Pyridoxamine 5'-phosphate oxidase family protein n=1 Tax=Halocatena marina TaxID=2934937 RepID=A0ABD5YSP9_9EURY|nr:pyridoxamine 5'-phosphate oxidase family protein [Halocatena marina]
MAENPFEYDTNEGPFEFNRHMTDDLPGSAGEHDLQELFETRERAKRFYEEAMNDSLTDRMQRFIRERIMFFLSTADANGETDCSPRFGPEGFVSVLDDNRLCYPEYRGNGVQASLGNMIENPHASFLFIDWWETTVGCHVNGRVELRDSIDGLTDPAGVDHRKVWVELHVEEAYIHCAKHVPKLSIEEFDPPWGTDDRDAKRAGYFSTE